MHKFLFSHRPLREERSAYCFGEGLRTVVYPGDEEPLLGFIYPNNASASQMLDEFGEGNPPCGVHMQVVLVPNVLLINVVCLHALSTATVQQEYVSSSHPPGYK